MGAQKEVPGSPGLVAVPGLCSCNLSKGPGLTAWLSCVEAGRWARQKLGHLRSFPERSRQRTWGRDKAGKEVACGVQAQEVS